MLKKPSLAEKVIGTTPAAVEGGSLAGHPTLWSHLSDGAYDGGEKRQLSTLLVFIHDGRLTAALNDRDNQRTLFVSGQGLEGLLAALEDNLCSGNQEWRPNAKGYIKKRPQGS